MKKKLFIPVALIIFFFLFSCKKESTSTENGSTPEVVPLSFTELKAQQAGIRVGETTTIIATATGANLTFNWSCTAGTIVGAGVEVTYGSTCVSCKGLNTITCTVSDGITNQTKSIEVSIN